MTALRRIAAVAVAFYRREPARVNAALATVLGPLLLRVGLDVDDATVLAVVGALLNVAVGEITRALVVPVAKLDAAPEWDDNAGFAEGGIVKGNLYPMRDERIHVQPWQPENPDVHTP